ncbi:MAG: isochorismate synthase [Deltaproteobacteria bacterium]|nr:isochorismate synthase [Deltaproteobacteria bacterium]
MRMRTLEVGEAPDVARAAMRLELALGMVDAERHGAGVTMRFEASLPHVDPLGWLAAWDGPGCYWASRDGRLTVAGRGSALAFRGEREDLAGGLEHAGDVLRGGGSRLRAFGGVGFAGSFGSLGGAWAAFGGYRFDVPAVEIGRDSNGCWMAAHLIAEGHEVAAKVEALRTLLHVPCARPPLRPLAPVVEIGGAPDRAAFSATMQAASATIAAGEVEKLVLARRIDLRFAERIDAVGLLEGLATREPSSFRFCLRPTAGAAFLGASPERLLRRDGRLLASEALAGTRPRGADDAADAELGSELLGSAKDRHEHALVVDAVRRALAPTCDGVEAAPAPALLRLARVQHLLTPIRGRLRRDVGDGALIEALHPTPAVGGAPRAAALAWLRAHEPFERGLYAAPIGWLGDDRAELCVGIRSMRVDRDEVALFAGAGVVAGSDPDAEWSEIAGKLRMPLELLGVDPETIG